MISQKKKTYIHKTADKNIIIIIAIITKDNKEQLNFFLRQTNVKCKM